MNLSEETIKNRLITYTPKKSDDLYDYLTQVCEYAKKNQQNEVDLNTTFNFTNNQSHEISFIFIDNFGVFMYEMKEPIESHYMRIRNYSQILRKLCEIYNIGSMIVSDSKFISRFNSKSDFDLAYSTNGFVPQLQKYPHEQQIIAKKENEIGSLKNMKLTVCIKSLSVNATQPNPEVVIKI